MSTSGFRRRNCNREAMLGIHHALRTRLQHPDQLLLCQVAMRRCVEVVREATASGPLSIELHDGAVHVAGEAVLTFHRGDAPFGPLRASGVGEIVLAQGIEAHDIEAFVQRLTTVTSSDDPEHDAAAILGQAGVPGVQLHAVTAEAGLEPGEVGADWWLLPAHPPAAAVLRPLVERDLTTNLVAHAARLLLDDLEAERRAPGDTLAGLLGRLLEDGDLATAAWLLERAANHVTVPAATVRALQAQARAACDDGWMRALLAHASRTDLLDGLGLVMQLGSDATARLLALAAEVAHPLVDWLDGLLVHRP